MQTIVIVDDHQLVAGAIQDMINQISNYKVLYHVTNGKELMEKFEEKKNIPDLILLDINMPIMDGFATMKWLHENHPEVRVLALSMNDDTEAYHKMVSFGASGFLSKIAPSHELKQAIEEVMTKGYYYTMDMANALFHAIQNKKVSPHVLLSEREIELLAFIGTELTYQEIADKMNLSVKTIDGYRNSLFQKLNIKSRTGLAMFAVKEGYFKIE